MTTVKQIERLWSGQMYGRLWREMLAQRPEDCPRLEVELGGNLVAAAAAMALIRLDELQQSHVPLAARLVRMLLERQEADGGWGDLPVTALAVRALRCGNGAGPAVERGIKYLADLQKSEGLWPAIPLRRTAADPFVTAFILLQLGGDPAFRAAVRLDEAAAWFERSGCEDDLDVQRLWRAARARCTPTRPRTPSGMAA